MKQHTHTHTHTRTHARTRARAAHAIGMRAARRRLVVLFATQKGNAKDIAEYVESLAGERGWECSVEPVDRVGKGLVLERTPVFVIVASTTGEGDVPDHAVAFLRHLRALTAGALARSSYAMLALGDTNYNHFCGGGRKIDAELQRAGAHAVVARGEADDASGYAHTHRHTHTHAASRACTRACCAGRRQ
jgi:sulfite reductase alpha subunit-like flavoprotein